MKKLILFLLSCGLAFPGVSGTCHPPAKDAVETGAEQSSAYLDMLRGKRVGLTGNHTSMVGKIHLLDFLLQEKINVTTVFAPEHGFRGEASAGETILDGKDAKTGVTVYSLFGKIQKPSPEIMHNLDIMVYDIQDVGCRFYTYLSTLYYVIEACAENHVPLLLLDRPNPNGGYVAGPVLKPEFTSFVGIVPVPVVHGCTFGEMARMIIGEKWTKATGPCQLTVIRTKNYTHATEYRPPVPPSPNLPNYQSIRLYPSLCFFEATSASIGRGTDFPFQVVGGTLPSLGKFEFTPVDKPGFANHPLNEGKTCYGTDLRNISPVPPFTLRYFMDFYHQYPQEKDFLTRERWMNLLSGTDQVIKMIREGKSEKEIVDSWQPDLERYRTIRKKYLLYPDSE
jgi:uncharacterized protein YbbC (DUF1343 family)